MEVGGPPCSRDNRTISSLGVGLPISDLDVKWLLFGSGIVGTMPSKTTRFAVDRRGFVAVAGRQRSAAVGAMRIAFIRFELSVVVLGQSLGNVPVNLIYQFDRHLFVRDDQDEMYVPSHGTIPLKLARSMV